MTLDMRDISIITQSAAHDAARIYVGIAPEGSPFDLGVFGQIHAQVYGHTKAFIESEQEQLGVGNIQAAFPGSQVMDMPPMPGDDQQDGQLFPPPQAPPQQDQSPVPYYPPVQQSQYFQQAAPAGYPPPQTQSSGQWGPPPAAPMAPPAMNLPGRCQKCGGEMYDNTFGNQQRRQAGFSLQPDYKCKSDACGNKIWPPDFQNFKHLPKPPMGFGR